KEQIVEDLREKKGFLFQGPGLHILILTLRCNEHCVYCHASSKDLKEKQYDMTKEIAEDVVKRIFESNNQKLCIEFQGGEPLVNFEVLKLVVEKAKELSKGKEVLFRIVTNLELMNKDKLNFLIENNFDICTSLDGPKELHNKNRGGYEKVIEWITKINEEYKKNNQKRNVNACLTLTKQSLDKGKEIIDEYIKQGMKEIPLRSLKKLGDARKNVEIYYSVEEFIQFWKKSLDYIIKLNLTGKLIIERKALIILQKLFETKDPGYADLRSPCGAVLGQVLYNYDGQVYTCDEGRMLDEDLFKIGNVKQSLTELTTNDEALAVISASINDSYICESCVYKPFCGVCPVLNYAEFGSTIGRIAESDWCKLHKAQFDYIFEKLKESQIKQVFMNWLKRKI
ncbi:His-Xaa-Ser system radical SAM maturase HxsB, partial [Candidatus Woesearchaeota archaeon]|nr:His-Xaa-Ser system radical SAM maturase HxsB [Candidatus Woesearchaeota archaeon]